jgi:hypothetical protein
MIWTLTLAAIIVLVLVARRRRWELRQRDLRGLALPLVLVCLVILTGCAVALTYRQLHQPTKAEIIHAPPNLPCTPQPWCSS